MATKKKAATTKPTERKPKAEPGSPQHLASNRPYTGCGDPRSWQERQHRRRNR